MLRTAGRRENKSVMDIHTHSSHHKERKRSRSPPPKKNGFSRRSPSPLKKNGFRRRSPPPQNKNGFRQRSPPPPQKNGFSRRSPPPPKKNGFCRRSPPPPKKNGFRQRSPPPQKNGFSRRSPPPQKKNGFSRRSPPPLKKNGFRCSSPPTKNDFRRSPPPKKNGFRNSRSPPPPPKNGFSRGHASTSGPSHHCKHHKSHLNNNHYHSNGRSPAPSAGRHSSSSRTKPTMTSSQSRLKTSATKSTSPKKSVSSSSSTANNKSDNRAQTAGSPAKTRPRARTNGLPPLKLSLAPQSVRKRKLLPASSSRSKLACDKRPSGDIKCKSTSSSSTSKSTSASKSSSGRTKSLSPLPKKRRVELSDETKFVPSPATSSGSSCDSNRKGEEFSNGATNSDELDELMKVDKWVRSAPDEPYYTREVNGHATATERTMALCEKFEETLVKVKEAREVAETLGDVRMNELIKLENAQIVEQRQLRKLKKSQKGKCCDMEKEVEGGCGSTTTTTEDSDNNGSECQTKAKETTCCNNDDNNSENSFSSSSGEDSSSSSSDEEDGFSMTRSDTANKELERRKKHPRRLHEELWHNDPGLMNDGPVCRCSAKARRFGIRHGFYPGEERIPPCNSFTNNKDKLFHYKITISPPKNFLISTPTVINHDGHEYIFEGFSIFSHYKLDLSLPPCKVIRFNIRYDVFVEEERFPESFCMQELQLFEIYLFREILELVDLKYEFGIDVGCSQFHLMPRFVRQLPDNGQEILSMSRVLIHLLKSDRELVREEDLHKLYTVEQTDWQNFADRHKGTIVTKWGMKPCAIRVDQIDRDVGGTELSADDGIPFPLIVHFGIRPPQLSYAGNAGYQRAWRRYVKYRHLLSNMPKPSAEDKLKLLKKELKLRAMRTAANMKRDVTVAISSRGFRASGICCDVVQHAMLIPVLEAHLRFHKCLETLEKRMEYEFSNRYLLQLAMTHPSYRENFGTNPDHARNALTNCGIRQPEYGDRRIHYASTRKRGINTLINIMAKFGADQETESDITHNERLEFLGDAVVEFVTSIHLFHIFPDLEEGGLATYRAAIVQNQHLAVLAQALNLDQYMLYAHGSDLCHDSELRHAMANCFEALMGALFLDGEIQTADNVFGNTLFGSDAVLLNMWTNYPKHPLQQEEPNGDRHWVGSHDVLQKLAEFEESIGIQYNHIRLLARAFTDRSLGYNNLTRGSNQRLEFLGDTVLQLISSEYLYRHFPDHHEGHLSLLRSSLVNNRTQSLVCDDLGMPLYAMRGDPKSEMKTKDRADLLEAFLGSLYIDKGLQFCHMFCKVCFFPRLSKSITKQEWNDPKSKLQQCCLTLRAMDGREPDIPVYKVTESLGPTNTRTYIVAVYFRGKRLATAQGHSIQEAEMNAAAVALTISGHLFPQLNHQRRIMDKTRKFH